MIGEYGFASSISSRKNDPSYPSYPVWMAKRKKNRKRIRSERYSCPLCCVVMNSISKACPFELSFDFVKNVPSYPSYPILMARHENREVEAGEIFQQAVILCGSWRLREALSVFDIKQLMTSFWQRRHGSMKTLFDIGHYIASVFAHNIDI